MEISQLPENMQAAAAPLTTPLPVPAPVLPVPSALPQQPDQQAQTDQSPAQAAPISTAPAASVTPGFADRLHDHVNAVASKMPPVPGSFARSLVAGALAALKSAPGVVSGIQDTFADASEAAKGAIPGEGILGAVGRIRAAETNRKQEAQKAQTQEDRERAAIALTSIQTLHQQALLHAASDAANHEDIANGRAFIKLYTEDQSALGLEPAKILFPDITEGQYQQYVASGAIDPTQTHFQSTGSFQPTGKDGKPMTDAAGMPMLQKTYTVVGNLPNLKLSAGKTLDLINSVPGIHFDVGQTLTGAQAASLIQQGQNMHAVAAKIAFDQEEAVKKSQLDQTKAVIDSNARLDADPAFLKASAHLPDLAALSQFVTGQLPSGRMVPEVVNGRPTGRQTPALGPDGQPEINPESLAYAQSHPTGLTDLRNRYGWTKEGESVYDKTLESQREKAEEARDKAASARGEKIPKTVNEATAAITTAAIAARDNPTPENKQALLDAHTRLDDLRSADVSQKYADATQRVKATRDAETDDLKTVAAELIKPDNMTALKDISSMRGDERIRLYAEAKKLDPNFQASTADRKIRFLTQFTNPNGKIMSNIASGNTFLEHAGDLHDVNQTYSLQNEKILRTPLTELQKLFGATAYTQLIAAINPVREEYQNALAAGFAPQGIDKLAGDTLLNDHSTPAQIEVAARQMSHTLLRRMDSSNQTYRTTMGGNYPDLITPNAREAVGKLGDKELQQIIDGYDTGGTIGAGPQVSPSAGQTHQGAPARTPAPTGTISVNPNVTDWAGQFGGVKR
jgi:hypothetical protein